MIRQEMEDGVQPGEVQPASAFVVGLGLSPTAITMLFKGAAATGQVRYRARHGVTLTDDGRVAALLLLRRHRIVETYLHRALGMDWADVHDEATRLDAAISEQVLERMDAVLGHPDRDPHGDPIPDPEGRMPTGRACCVHANGSGPLSGMGTGLRVRIEHIVGNDVDLLRLLGRQGLHPRAIITVTANDHAAGTLSVVTDDGRETVLGLPAATRIHVSQSDVRHSTQVEERLATVPP